LQLKILDSREVIEICHFFSCHQGFGLIVIENLDGKANKNVPSTFMALKEFLMFFKLLNALSNACLSALFFFLW
jgi:hypothetical protein